MTRGFIRYRERKYKYQLVEGYQVKVNILGYDIRSDLYTLWEDGALIIREGYAWDGASGPTLDSSDSMRASLVHDVLYQMIRDVQLPPSEKDAADREFHRILIEDGMDRIRANAWYDGVHLFGTSSCVIGSGQHEIKTAPRQEV